MSVSEEQHLSRTVDFIDREVKKCDRFVGRFSIILTFAPMLCEFKLAIV